MKTYISIGTAVVMALLFAVPLQAMAGHWYVGGTLYNVTAREWRESSRMKSRMGVTQRRGDRRGKKIRARILNTQYSILKF